MQRDNLTPFYAHDYLLRRWFDLVSIADPIVGQTLKSRLSNQYLNMSLTCPGLVAEVRRDISPKGGRVIVEDERTVTKGIINRRSIKLPARLVYRAAHVQITLYAPSVTPHGKLRAGTLKVEVFAGKLPHEKGEAITATFHYKSVVETYEAQRPRLSVTKTVDALETEDLNQLIRLQPLIEVLKDNEPARLLLNHVFEKVSQPYAKNDQWSADLKRLAILTNKEIAEANQ